MFRAKSQASRGSNDDLLHENHPPLQASESLEDDAGDSNEKAMLGRRRSMMSQTSIKRLFKWKNRLVALIPMLVIILNVGTYPKQPIDAE